MAQSHDDLVMTYDFKCKGAKKKNMNYWLHLKNSDFNVISFNGDRRLEDI